MAAMDASATLATAVLIFFALDSLSYNQGRTLECSYCNKELRTGK